MTLGPLGTALAAPKVRAVLIDEIDKSDLDLPGDLLNVMENGEFTDTACSHEHEASTRSQSAARTERQYEVDADGVVRRRHFPVIVFTSNEERAFSAAVPTPLRPLPDADRRQGRPGQDRHCAPHSDAAAAERGEIEDFAKRLEDFAKRLREERPLAINQILEFVYLVTGDSPPASASRKKLAEILLKELSGT